ncbi:MAG: hypothetical protein WKG06_16195 [Segetibacter sp.]
MVPLVALLAQKSGANFWLVQGALASATVWGNAVCFYSDNRVLIAQATKADLITYSLAQLPYQLLILLPQFFYIYLQDLYFNQLLNKPAYSRVSKGIFAPCSSQNRT